MKNPHLSNRVALIRRSTSSFSEFLSVYLIFDASTHTKRNLINHDEVRYSRPPLPFLRFFPLLLRNWSNHQQLYLCPRWDDGTTGRPKRSYHHRAPIASIIGVIRTWRTRLDAAQDDAVELCTPFAGARLCTSRKTF